MLLAFIHTEKTGGTTLNQVLRRNFFMGFADVRPLARSSGPRFGAADFRIYRRLNPRLCAISGHAVRPGLDLGPVVGDIRYVTLLRDPAKRYVSQFLYFVRLGMRTDDFGKYLDEAEFMNVQTRKIAGPEGPRVAAERLDGMLAVGALVAVTAVPVPASPTPMGNVGSGIGMPRSGAGASNGLAELLTLLLAALGLIGGGLLVLRRTRPARR